ncbi:DUF559 domain-containing protein [Bordetella avium]|uniref:AAA domain-containing protein n=1 Tax=Bordetella avium TaxID=521 RepID=UPI000E68E62C|nr:AAA domain-containing protein [Bordetella avium]RIQ18105.1 DUF559 domain-containing protein [Bordetella avium]RIQ36578.1 DUF559 domain-containing protein [Bordetella avium]
MKFEVERLLAMIEYAKQTVLIKKTPAQNIAQHKAFARLEDQILGLPGVSFNMASTDDDDEPWLRVERLHESMPPMPANPHLAAWVELARNPLTEPVLKAGLDEQYLIEQGLREPPAALVLAVESTAIAKAAPKAPITLAEYEDWLQAQGEPSLAAMLKQYLADEWRAWARQEKEVRKSIALYKDMFMLSQTLQGNLLDASLELVWGIGMAVQKQDSATITYPLITKAVELSLDDRTMALEVRPCASDPRLELELFAALDNPGVAALEEVAKAYLTEGVFIHPGSPETFDGLLRSATSMLDATGAYQPDLPEAPTDRKLPKAGPTLAVTDTWALVARPRAANLMVQDLSRFARVLENASAPQALPGALRALFVEPSSELEDVELPAYRGLAAVSGSGGEAGRRQPAELYFPKAYNDEQVQIVQMLDVHDGVVVQGPPGTGKTHTIANVICHYLACGKRVLVTSMKDPALAVLQEKLPEAIRPLAISLLASEADGMRQFDSAISKIAAEVTRIDRHQYRQDIETYDREIDATHERLSRIDRDIAKWARINLEKLDLDGQLLSPLEVAEEVARFGAQADWFPDALTIEPACAPVFGNDLVAALRSARLRLGSDIGYLGAQLADEAAFPAPARLYQANQDLRLYAELKAKEAAGEVPALSAGDNIALAETTLGQLGALHQRLRDIEDECTPWAKDLQTYLRKHPRSDMLDLFISLRTDVLAAISAHKQFLIRPVACPDGMEVNVELCKAVENLAAGRKAFGLAGMFGKSEEKRQLDAVTVLGSKPGSEQDWVLVRAHLAHLTAVRKLLSRWNTLAQEIPLPSCNQLGGMERALALIDKLQESRALERSLIDALQTLIPTWDKAGQQPLASDMITEASGILRQHLLKHRLSDAAKIKEALIQALDACTGEVSGRLRDFVNTEFGSATLTDAVMQQRWSDLMAQLHRAHALAQDLTMIAEATAKIEQCGAPQWAARLRTEPAAPTHDALLPDDWAAVWRVRRLANFIEKTDGRAELKRLSLLRGELEKDLSARYQQAVSARTWLKLTESATPDVRSALEAYRNAIKKIGKTGTGVRAGRFRQDARNAAAGANKAIPCWIMPHYRVSESLPAIFGDFDLVIIDEASQSDLSALPAIMRAKKILVVGDDKQVSPEGVGLEESKIKALLERFLSNQVRIFAPQMTPDRSIYDLFKVVFSSSAVMLREHFRSVAPIIEYSKREFYGHELRPLRMPTRSERLDPPLIDVYVEDGVKRGELNVAEANFIVAEIKAIVANPQLAGRTIGVVSLIGNKQALHIMQRLTEELGEEVVTQYQITCGDARNFQGKERDIMFLSMIVSPDDAHPQTQVGAEQRFNVAASRARDRMYLVRSVELDDLRPSDVLRARLIQHFQAPFLQNEQDLASHREKCESGFEREVYDLLTEKGYRVIPQVPVGAYRIDMVVEGDNDSRLAIECDGDRYHGPEQWESDMRRQRILERAGWTFWRSFASTFVRHRDEVVADLLDTLARLEIHPSCGDGVVRSIHTDHRVVQGMAEQGVEPGTDGDAEFDEALALLSA